MAAYAILNFQKFKFLTVGSLGRPILHSFILPNFIKIGQSIAEYGDFSISQDGGRPTSLISKSVILMILCGPECPYASLCQIWLKTVEWLRRYCDLTAFQNGSRIQIIVVSSLRNPILHHPAEFHRDQPNSLLRYCDFSRRRPSIILNLLLRY